ncbi:MAG: ACP S-malonyltransferase [Christensenellales bacterium]
MGQLAFLFPGQGTQQPGMGSALYAQSPAARALMDRAETRMPGLLARVFGGSPEDLARTDLAQPALFAVHLALAAAAESLGLRPSVLAGASLGEWSAVCYGGLMAFPAAFDLVRRRGAWMQDCATQNPGGMSAVLRLDGDQVLALLARHPGVFAANFNAPAQTVVAGPLPALEAFEEAVKAEGGRTLRLKVAGAFHTPLMQAASDHLAEALAQETLTAPRLNVYSNLSARPHTLGEARQALALQASRPVQWVETVRHLAASGVDSFLELGPGQVLSGLVRSILPGARCLQADDLPGLMAARAILGEAL